MFNKTIPWEKPVQKLKSKMDFICEMSDYEQYFLCGLIRDRKPKKVVEIGIAEGSTTAVIYEALSLLGRQCEMYSIDIDEQLYYDRDK